jgi:hypothetical protein
VILLIDWYWKEGEMMDKKNSNKETDSHAAASEGQEREFLRDSMLTTIIKLMCEMPGGATEEEIRDVLDWAEAVFIQFAFLQLFLEGKVAIVFGSGQHQPGPSSDKFQARWELFSSVMARHIDNPEGKKLVVEPQPVPKSQVN